MGSGRAHTSKKRRKPVNGALEEVWPTPPTEQEFNNMPSHKAFVVTDDEGVQFKFEKAETVLILPHGFDPKKRHEFSTYWVAKIKDIRGSGSDINAVWVRVQWYYSGKDLSEVMKSFDRHSVGPFERIYSDHCDFVQPEAFEMVIPMYHFKEFDHEQSYIPQDSFYRRYTFEYLAPKIKPKPGAHSCVCNQPYNPNDTNPERLMHFCPRPSCRKAFHHHCLMARKSKEASTTAKSSLTVKIPQDFSNAQGNRREDEVEGPIRSARKHAVPPKKSTRKTRGASKLVANGGEASTVVIATANGLSLSGRDLRLLACSPDTNDNIDLHALIPSSDTQIVVESDSEGVRPGDDDSDEQETVPRKIGPPRGRPKPKDAPNSRAVERPSLDSILATIPSDLLTIAIQPLVRGGAFVEGGIAGNIGMVSRGRRLVYTALQMGSGKYVDSDWEDTVFGEDRDLSEVELKNAVVRVTFNEGRAEKDDGLPPFVCPHCKSAI